MQRPRCNGWFHVREPAAPMQLWPCSPGITAMCPACMLGMSITYYNGSLSVRMRSFRVAVVGKSRLSGCALAFT